MPNEMETGMLFWSFPNQAYLLGGPNNEDHSILLSIYWGSLFFGKLPYGEMEKSVETPMLSSV